MLSFNKDWDKDGVYIRDMMLNFVPLLEPLCDYQKRANNRNKLYAKLKSLGRRL